MITTIYHVSVDIPNDVWQAFNDTPEYQQKVCEATKGSIDAGSDSYSEPYEYADFETLDAAELCECRLNIMVAYFKRKLRG